MLRVRFDNVDKENSAIQTHKRVDKTPILTNTDKKKISSLSNRALKDITNSNAKMVKKDVLKMSKEVIPEVEYAPAPIDNAMMPKGRNFDHLAKATHLYASQLRMLEKLDSRNNLLCKEFDENEKDDNIFIEDLEVPLPF